MKDIQKIIEELQFLQTTLLEELKEANGTLSENLGKVETVILKVQDLIEQTKKSEKRDPKECFSSKKITYFMYFVGFISLINSILLFFML